jgi:DMSO/TMAO reductase YedYZ molybdopterin-dependent catalytic subunit
MSEAAALPSGQRESDHFPRFGLPRFATRFPRDPGSVELRIDGNVKESIAVSAALRQLPRVSQSSDFHCVTTWSRRSLRWSGVRFADFFEHIVVPGAGPDNDATFVVLRCQDGYRCCLPLADLLADDVLLADTLDGEPLTIEHGAPLRLVAPMHYGYKSAKHVSRVEFWRDDRGYRPAGLRFMEHPRARVALEERGRVVPGLVLRFLYRPLVRPTIARFRRAMDDYTRDHRPGH